MRPAAIGAEHPSRRHVTEARPSPAPAFAHASEAEMARILDFYEVHWLYEPDTFPLLWSLSGAVVESFTPDFYLPDFDIYLELTTLKQSLVRKKNRKLRRLRALYPDVRIKLFYARDFRALMLKYGRTALADSLSGTSGQVPSPRGQGPTPAGASDDPVDHAPAPVPTAGSSVDDPPAARRRTSETRAPGAVARRGRRPTAATATTPPVPAIDEEARSDR